MEGKTSLPETISFNKKKARICTKKDTLQRLVADLHAEQAFKLTKKTNASLQMHEKLNQNQP